MTAAAAPEPEEGKTAFAEPSLLDAVLEENVFADPPQLKSRFLSDPVRRLLESKFVHADDVPREIDVRDWPQVPGMPEQFVQKIPNFEAPRLRQLRFSDGRIVYEAWTRVPKPVETAEEMASASQGVLPIAGWKITYHLFEPRWCECPKARLEHVTHEDGSTHLMHPGCGREREPRVDGPMDEHVMSLQLAPEDDATYNGTYPTLPGDDVVHFTDGKKGMEAHRGDPVKRANPLVINGKVVEPYLRGGTHITGGRAEHRRRTKGMIHLGPGYTKDIEKIQAAKEAKKKADLRDTVERKIQLAPRKPFEV